VFKSEETPVKGSSETGVIIKRGEKVTNEARSFVILEYNSKTKNISELSQSSDNVYSIVDETAVPSAGMTDYYKFISENLSYPLNAKTKGTEGKVFVEFIVETDGTLSDVKVMKGVSPELDAEALRVVKLSPRWVPGKQDGVSVRQKMVLPINFSL
jgi:protein TonB